MVVSTSIVIVNIQVGRVVVNKEVMMDVPPLHVHGRLTCPHSGQVGLAVPGIEWSMISRFPASRKYKVVAELITAAKSVVVIDTSARSIEENIALDCGLCRLSLHVEAALLLIETNLPGSVPHDVVVARMIP